MREWVRGVRKLLENGTPVYAVGSAFTYDHRWRLRKTLQAQFQLERIGSHLTEDYHRSELHSAFYDSPLIRLSVLPGVGSGSGE